MCKGQTGQVSQSLPIQARGFRKWASVCQPSFQEQMWVVWVLWFRMGTGPHVPGPFSEGSQPSPEAATVTSEDKALRLHWVPRRPPGVCGSLLPQRRKKCLQSCKEALPNNHHPLESCVCTRTAIYTPLSKTLTCQLDISYSPYLTESNFWLFCENQRHFHRMYC